jgi:hypothetical protein
VDASLTTRATGVRQEARARLAARGVAPVATELSPASSVTVSAATTMARNDTPRLQMALLPSMEVVDDAALTHHEISDAPTRTNAYLRTMRRARRITRPRTDLEA